jgi:hypothetical protein
VSGAVSQKEYVEKVIRDMLVGTTISRTEYFTILALAEDIENALKRTKACKSTEALYHSIDPYGWLAMDVECDGKVYRVEVPMILRVSEYEKNDIKISTRAEL